MPSEPTIKDPETPPFQGIGFMLSSLGHAVSNRFALILKPYGLEPREFALLRRISLAEGSTQQAIGEMLGIQAPRMVALIDSLQERGLLERRLSPSDRRARALYLTETGKSSLQQATEAAVEFERTIAQDLSSEQRTDFSEMLALIARRLEIPPGVHGSHIAGHDQPGPCSSPQ
jgi:DNA-binding MarR family transcriptional regulator